MGLITGNDIKGALQNAFAALTIEKDNIDNLNVFPVPDGDTGTNMLLTYRSGYNAIKDLENENVDIVMKSFSKGLLMGARGNSGVILSQIFRGLSISFQDKDKIDAFDFIEALVKARETAYKAVMNPVEGTILSVISDMSKDVYKYRDNTDVKMVLSLAIETGEKSLENTPNLLPVLKEAGVVDSGGYGLIVIFKAFKKYFDGEIIDISQEANIFDSAKINNEPTEFGYCTEYIIELDEKKIKENNFSEQKLKQQLNKLGDSLVVVYDEELVKVHVHTLAPGEVLNIGQKYGEFIKLKIENMTVQHDEIIDKKKKEKYAIIAVSSGSGISNLLKKEGVTNIVEGGQTMNPSTSDFVSLIEKTNAEKFIILPNNSNIIMATMQAKEIIEKSTKKHVEVVPTKSIIQCLASLSFFNSKVDIKHNLAEMTAAYDDVNYGEVTYAVRDTVMNNVKIKEGEFIGIFNKKIINSMSSKTETLFNLISAMVNDETSLITIIYGKDVSENDIENIRSRIENNYKYYDLEIINGNQDVYSFLIGVE
ncbi:MAG: DAK2 domain-containing protein [Bacilli bacterium]